MVSNESINPTGAKSGAMPFLDWGQERSEAAMALQKAVLESYEEASRAWLARVRSEVSLWSELASKLSVTRSVPEAVQIYANCVSQRLQMAVDDGRRLAEEAQVISQKFAKSLGNGGKAAST
jgi:Phasin protein